MHNTNKMIREGGGLLSSSALNLSAMSVGQIISFFGELLGKSEAAFNSAGVVGKLFYGITTLILKGLNMIGSWVSSLTNWLVTAMGGTVPGAGNLTYAQLLIYGAICAVLVWGLRRVWRRIRGRNSGYYYESEDPINQKRLYLQIREDIRTIDRMTVLTEIDNTQAPAPQQAAQANAPTNQYDSNDAKKAGICSRIVGFISRMATEAAAMTTAFAKDVYGPQSRYPNNKKYNYEQFAQLAVTAGNGVNGFLARCAGKDPNTFRSKLMQGAFVNRAILDRIVKGAAFYAFPGLTTLWFGGRVVSARLLKNPRITQMIQSKVTELQSSGKFLSTFSKTITDIIYDKSGDKWTNNSRSKAYEQLAQTLKSTATGTYTKVKNFIGTNPNWGALLKTGLRKTGSAISQGIVLGAAGAGVAAATAARLGYKGAKFGLKTGIKGIKAAGSGAKELLTGTIQGVPEAIRKINAVRSRSAATK